MRPRFFEAHWPNHQIVRFGLFPVGIEVLIFTVQKPDEDRLSTSFYQQGFFNEEKFTALVTLIL